MPDEQCPATLDDVVARLTEIRDSLDAHAEPPAVFTRDTFAGVMAVGVSSFDKLKAAGLIGPKPFQCAGLKWIGRGAGVARPPRPHGRTVRRRELAGRLETDSAATPQALTLLTACRETRRADPLSPNKAAAAVMLSDLLKKLENEKAGIRSPLADAQRKPLSDLLTEYERHQLDRGSTPKHAAQAVPAGSCSPPTWTPRGWNGGCSTSWPA